MRSFAFVDIVAHAEIEVFLIHVGFRFDDLSPASDRKLEQAIVETFVSRGCKATLAVIPFKRVNGELNGLMQEGAGRLARAAAEGTVEIALHGFAHERRTSTPRGKPSEFSGLASADQLELIAHGLTRLKGVFGDNVMGFVPPWNTFDGETLKALKKLGFLYLSAAWDVPNEHRGDVVVIPRTCNLSSLKAALSEARRVQFLSPVIVAVLHHYDFAESGTHNTETNLPAFGAMLDWLSQQRDVTISSLAEIAAGPMARGWSRAISRYQLGQALHWRLKGLAPQLCLLSAPLWRLIMPARRAIVPATSKAGSVSTSKDLL
jgi:peptidoglycan/xylan/chitin deacetylase (PgdA/CDA1 family)